MNTVVSQQQKPILKQDELILVVKRKDLFPQNESWHGIKTDKLNIYLDRIKEKQHYGLRSLMEIDENYKQICSYVIFKFEDKLFLMQRRASASEQRLKNKLSLGIGGHLRKEDIENKTVFEWALREFNEEVNYQGKVNTSLLGMINVDDDAVGRVHFGLIFLAEGFSDKISIRSELKEGKLVKITDLKNYYNSLESWSQIVLDYING